MQSKHRVYNIKFNFLPYECYQEEKYVKPGDILQFMESRFFKILLEVIKKKCSKLASYNTVSTRRAVQRDVEDGEENGASQENQEDNEAEAEEEGRVPDIPDGETGEEDVDASDAKRKANQEEEVDYESDDDNEAEDDDILEQEENEVNGRNSEAVESQDETYAPSSIRRAHNKKMDVNKLAQQRISAVLENHDAAESYTYDIDNELWCEISLKLPLMKEYFDFPSLLTSLANDIVIHETKGMTRCLLNESSNKNGEVEFTLQTEGINLPELFRYDDVCNYTFCVSHKVTERKIRIVVDPRHLSLVSDYMCFEGIYKPLNRFGIQSNSSPLQQMTFETSYKFLKEATMLGNYITLFLLHIISCLALLYNPYVEMCATHSRLSL
ncbi:hypothetical protein JD844_002389 [Phrynosoma platyrhinos]|uniref:DNA-directed RNA polymerase n=1 Tax=Phrynosoma platyrhinos TaxID=52577 RepID=A0ABQ7TBE4_PHRPL|nr:hypothetical protein JD844_002389 [Phrynosoma platyrhinos]